MSRKILISTLSVIVLVVLGLSLAGLAQAFQQPIRQPRTLADHLDDIGKSIFGGLGPPAEGEHPRLLRTSQSGASPTVSRSPTPAGTASRAAVRSPYRRPAATPVASSRTKATVATAPAARATTTRAQATVRAEEEKTGPLPLHERLKEVRRSFGSAPAARPPQPTAEQRQPRPAQVESAPVGMPQTAPVSKPIGAKAPTAVESATPSSAVPARANTPRAPASSSGPRRPTIAPTASRGPRSPAAAPKARSAESDRVLFTQRSPVLNVETLGPRKITVGKQSVYEMTIRNSGDVDADDVVVTVVVPQWAEVVGAEASTGATSSSLPGEAAGTFRWKVGRLSAKGQEKLSLKIVPRQSRPFDLAVKWDYMPVASQAMIEVQEPKLAIHMEGPREVVYGDKNLYQLRLSNPGTGDAEKVSITLHPIGKENQPASHQFGTLKAGEEKTIAVELTARETGNVAIRVSARGEGDLRAELTEQVLVRRAEMMVEVEGPAVQFVGATATYRIRIRNAGNAAARNLRLTAKIPPGAKYVSASGDAVVEADGTKVTWHLDDFGIGMERVVDVQCQLTSPGTARLEALASADQGLSESTATATRVDAMADLVLDIVDPSGPVPVGSEAAYEIRVQNRGTKGAQNVEIIACFSRGVDPTSVEGGLHRIHDGQILFNPIPSIDAGKQVVFKIRARAQAAGNHIFRAEVFCKPLGTRLVSEETSHYYEGGLAAQRSSTSGLADGASDGDSTPAHTADRRALPQEAPPDSIPSRDTKAPATDTDTETR